MLAQADTFRITQGAEHLKIYHVSNLSLVTRGCPQLLDWSQGNLWQLLQGSAASL